MVRFNRFNGICTGLVGLLLSSSLSFGDSALLLALRDAASHNEGAGLAYQTEAPRKIQVAEDLKRDSGLDAAQINKRKTLVVAAYQHAAQLEEKAYSSYVAAKASWKNVNAQRVLETGFVSQAEEEKPRIMHSMAILACQNVANTYALLATFYGETGNLEKYADTRKLQVVWLERFVKETRDYDAEYIDVPVSKPVKAPEKK